MHDDIFVKLEQRPWYRATAPSLQQRLRALPEHCRGFLEDLAARPSEGGGVRLINLDALLVPDTGKVFGIFVIFRVQRLDNPALVYWYQYFSWAQGPASGAKGVVLVRRGSDVTHVLTLRGFKFATGAVEHDCVGGFAEVSRQGIEGVLKNFEREIAEELGVSTLRLQEVIPIGRLRVDAGLTNSAPALFAAIVDGVEMSKVPSGEVPNPDPFELRARTVVTPVEALWGSAGLVAVNDDAFFLACIVRLVSLGILQRPA